MNVTIEDLLSGRVRLTFGDSGQLAAIKTFEARQEAALNMCKTCDGEGTIVCEDCDGTGERHK